MSQNTPIILLGGAAGSGKDTAGSFLVDTYNAVTIGQADPMKRFVSSVFRFNEAQLWGPSELRNAPDSRFSDRSTVDLVLDNLEDDYTTNAGRWLNDVLPPAYFGPARGDLDRWFSSMLGEIASTLSIAPRKVLQTLGTEWGRGVDLNMWSTYALRAARKLLAGGYRYTRTEGLVYDPEATPPDYVAITDGRFRNEMLAVREINGLAIKIVRDQADAQAVETGGVRGHISEKELAGVPGHFFNFVVDNSGSIGRLHSQLAHVMEAAFDDARGFE